MATKRQATVTVKSVISSIGTNGYDPREADVTELSSTGEIMTRDGITRILYTESTEGGKVDCELIFKGETVRLKRRGAVSLDLELTPGIRYDTVYSIPPYKFDIWAEAKQVCLDLDEDGASVALVYDMCIGGEERRAEMQIFAKHL